MPSSPSKPLWPLKHWLGPATALTFFACTAYVAVIFWTGSSDLLKSIARIGAGVICAGTAVCGATILIRFLRWHHILHSLGYAVPAVYSLRVYLAGLALSSTPGKVGETMRSALLVPLHVPVSRSVGAFIADRLSDVIAVATLGAVSGWLALQRQPLLESMAAATFLMALLASAALRSRVGLDGLQRAARQEGPARWIALARMPALAWAEIWRGWRPLGYVALGLGAYGLQALVFAGYVTLIAPGIDPAVCVAIFASSTLIGAASLVPAGLGAMDSALVFQLHAHGVTWPDAVGAALAIRASTLWLAWLLGLATLMTFAALRPRPSVFSDPRSASR